MYINVKDLFICKYLHPEILYNAIVYYMKLRTNRAPQGMMRKIPLINIKLTMSTGLATQKGCGFDDPAGLKPFPGLFKQITRVLYLS